MGVSIMPLKENLKKVGIPTEEPITWEAIAPITEGRTEVGMEVLGVREMPISPIGIVPMERPYQPPKEMPAKPISVEKKPTKVEKKEVKPPEPKTKEKSALESVADESIKLLLKEEEQYSNIVKTANEELKKSREKYLSKIDELTKKIDEWGNELDTLYQKISEELVKPLPKPPTREEVVEPKQPILALLKELTPFVVGLTALLRPGRYGENLFYFNSMYQAIRDSDDRKFKEALDKWQRELQIGLAEKNNKINALKTLADGIKSRMDILGTTGQLALKGIEVEISGWEDQIKNANAMIDRINKAIEKIEDKLYKQKDLEIKQQQLEADILYKTRRLEIERTKPLTEFYKFLKDKEREKGAPLTQEDKEKAKQEFLELKKPSIMVFPGLKSILEGESTTTPKEPKKESEKSETEKFTPEQKAVIDAIEEIIKQYRIQ